MMPRPSAVEGRICAASVAVGFGGPGEGLPKEPQHPEKDEKKEIMDKEDDDDEEEMAFQRRMSLENKMVRNPNLVLTLA